MNSTEETLLWVCDICRKSVAGVDGYIHVHLSLGSWEIHHYDCDPFPDRSDYWFSVDRADTYKKILSWTLHLYRKKWFADTDWDSFLGVHSRRVRV